MISIDMVVNDAQRLRALQDLNILHSPANPVFLDLLREAALSLGADTACIKLLDDEQAHVFVSLGAPSPGVPASRSLCARAIASGQRLYLEDLAWDARQPLHPWAVIDPSLQSAIVLPFYCRQGHALGALCLFLHQTSDIQPPQRTRLLDIADTIGRQVEFFYGREAKGSTRDMLSFLSLLPEPCLVSNEAGEIVQVSPEAEQLLGYGSGELTGKTIESLLPERLRAVHAANRETFHRNPYPRPMGGQRTTYEIMNRRGEPLYVEINLTPLHTETDRLTVINLNDVTGTTRTRNTLFALAREPLAPDDQEAFAVLAGILAKELSARAVIIARLDAAQAHAQPLVQLVDNVLCEGESLVLAGSPGAQVISEGECVVPQDLSEAFPEDAMARRLSAQAYVGLRLNTASGEVCGMISVYLDHSLSVPKADIAQYLLQMMALRISPELERQDTEKTLLQLSKSVELSPNAVAITDRQARIEYVNPRFTEMTGFSREECIGKKASINSSGATPPALYASMWKTILAGEEWQGELQNCMKDGRLYWARTKIFPIKNGQDDITHFVSIQEDISRDKQLTEQLKYEASHDQLTGLINRREFERRLQVALEDARDNNKVHSLCFIDLDHFKVLNDTSGHIAGDTLLKQVGDLLRRAVRSQDTAARLGGDEFALLLFNCPPQEARRVTEELLEGMNTLRFTWEDKSYNVGASIGINAVTGEAKDSVELLKQVDVACYAAKEKGKNQVHVYSASTIEARSGRHATNWVPLINAALDNDRFRLYLQPVVPTSLPEQLDRAFYHEVLLRMLDAEGNLIEPNHFLPSVEHYNLAVDVDRYVITKAFQWIHEAPEAMLQFNGLGLNLSGASISDPRLLDFILSTLKDRAFPAQMIKFEITETATISNIEQARYFMEQVRAEGGQIVLDDFGSGLSSFPYLKNLPVDILKIDGAMVRDIAKDRVSQVMVKMINEMAHNLGFRTVGEYVEDLDILRELMYMGIDYVQGFAIARPQPFEPVQRVENGLAGQPGR